MCPYTSRSFGINENVLTRLIRRSAKSAKAGQGLLITHMPQSAPNRGLVAGQNRDAFDFFQGLDQIHGTDARAADEKGVCIRRGVLLQRQPEKLFRPDKRENGCILNAQAADSGGVAACGSWPS